MQYKKYTLEPTDENILKSIKEDTFGRSKDIKNFIEGLDMIDKNMFISLDARWGEGKTFYVRQIETTLKYLYQKKFNFEERKHDSDDEKFNNIFSNSVLDNIELNTLYKPIYYNAWLYDCHKDPLMSLLYVLVKEIRKYISTNTNSEKISEKLISIASSFSISVPFVGIDLKKINDSLKGKDILEEIKTAEDIRKTVKEIFDEIIVESTEKLVIFIDELDRCRPDFAIETLERIKHYFDDDRIIFVVSINKEQLIHTISKYYGEQFDSTRYLNKFFDINIYLPKISNDYTKKYILNTERHQYVFKKVVEELCKYYNLSLRDTLIFYQNVDATLKDCYDSYTDKGCTLSLFVPIILVLEIVDQKAKKDFMNGEFQKFRELCENIKVIRKIVCRCYGDGSDGNENFENGYKRIYEVYEKSFKNELIYDGELDIDRDLKNLCIRICNGYDV